MMNKSNIEADIVALFDGKCMMCNSFIRLLDRAGQGSCRTLKVTPHCQKFFHLAEEVISKEIVKTDIEQTILVYELGVGNEVLKKSRAIARLLCATKSRRLKALSIVIEIIPTWISDLAYDVVSRIRKKIPTGRCNIAGLEWIIVDE